jgi:hypothetical protein
MDTLRDRRPGAAEEAGDLLVGEVFPCIQAEHLLICRPQPAQRLHDLLTVGSLHQLDLGSRVKRGSKAADPANQPAQAPDRATLVRQYLGGDAIQPAKKLVVCRELIETAPHHEENLGRGVVGVCPLGATQAVRQDVAMMLVVERIEPLLPL